jgi:hypothetical protein
VDNFRLDFQGVFQCFVLPEVELDVCWLEQLQVVVLQVLYHHRRR